MKLVWRKVFVVMSLIMVILASGCGRKQETKYQVILRNEFGSDYVIYDIAEGAKIDLLEDDPEKEGYLFLGWFYGDELWDFDNDVITEDTIIDARFEPIVYDINYHINGGTLKPDSPLTFTIENDSIVLEDPEKEGYQFAGWYLSESSMEELFFVRISTRAQDMDVYALWEPNEYAIDYYLTYPVNRKLRILL